MIGTRILLAVSLLAVPVAASADGPGLLNRRARVDQSRVRLLAEVLRTESDEAKRRAAVLELAEADPRANPDVIPTLVGALKKDTAAAVRAAAADVIGRFRVVFPVAGAALEAAADGDPNTGVKDAARQALWEYHLNGYRSPKGSNAFATQTAEPPIAKPAPPAPPKAVPVAVTAEPPRTPVIPTTAALPAPPLPAVSPVPHAEVMPGPRVMQFADSNGLRGVLASVNPPPSATAEPPIARRGPDWAPPPATLTEPPFLRPRPVPVRFGETPKLIMELPPIVPDPGPIPGVVPFPEPTGEPPIGKRG